MSGKTVACAASTCALVSLLLAGVAAADSLHVRCIGHYPDTLSWYQSEAVAVSGDYAYITARQPDSVFIILSVADPAHPVLVSRTVFDLLSTEGSYIVVVGDFAYLAGVGLQIFSVADRAHPVKVGHCDTPHEYGDGIAVSGSYAYVACDSYGLRVISVADPANPIEVGYWDTPGQAVDVKVVGDYAYVSDADSGLYVLSVKDPTHPIEVGRCVLVSSGASTVTVSGDYAYVAGGDRSFRVLSIADPAHPFEVGRLDSMYFIHAVTIVGDKAFVADLVLDTGKMRVISVADPANPVEIGYYSTGRCYSADTGRGYVHVGSTKGQWVLQFYKPGDLDVDNDSLDVVADTIRLRGSGSYARGEFVLANTSAAYNPDTYDGPSLSILGSLRFTGSLSGPGGTLDSVLIPNLPLSRSLAQGQVVICSLAVFTPPGLKNGDYTGAIVIAGRDTAGFLISDTFYAIVRKLGDIDVDNDSLDVVADTISLRPRLVSVGPPPHYTECALGEFVLVNTSTSYNPDTADGPSKSWVDSLRCTGTLVGPGGTIDSVLVLNLPGSLAQGQAIVCTLAAYVPPEIGNGPYKGLITVSGKDSLGYLTADTFYARLTKLGDLDVDDDSLNVVHDTINLRTQPAGPVYHPYAKAEFMLVNTSSAYNPDTADGPSHSLLREFKVEAKVEAQGRAARTMRSEHRMVKSGSDFHSSQFTIHSSSSADSIYVLNLPESLAIGQAVKCTLALVIPTSESLGSRSGWVVVSALDTAGYPVRDSFVLVARGPQPRQNLDSLRVAPIPFKPHTHPEQDAIHFQGLSAGARVTIYDNSGQSVWSATEQGDGQLKWDAKVASGIYVYLVVSADGKSSKVGKLSVIR
ncbi:MAG TPA: T9SS type A sorting domain-containing protein [bacterium]|nr:T9SS type A sorting domain-containing protein [bacterium]